MATISGAVQINIRATQAAPTGYTGGDTFSVSVDDLISSGTGLKQADQGHSSAISVTGSSNVDQSLLTLTSPAGAALSGLVELMLIVFEWPSTATGALTITPSASNGLTALGSSIVIQPGGKVIHYCPQAAAYAVDATHKSLNFANAGTTASVTVTLLGRSA